MGDAQIFFPSPGVLGCDGDYRVLLWATESSRKAEVDEIHGIPEKDYMLFIITVKTKVLLVSDRLSYVREIC